MEILILILDALILFTVASHYIGFLKEKRGIERVADLSQRILERNQSLAKLKEQEEKSKEIVLRKIVGDCLLSFSPDGQWIEMDNLKEGELRKLICFTWENSILSHEERYNLSQLYNTINSWEDIEKEYFSLRKEQEKRNEMQRKAHIAALSSRTNSN